MLINIITCNNNYGLTSDITILKSCLQTINSAIKFNIVNYYQYQCDYADINIFLEIPVYALIPYANINILIPNQEWYYKSWISYIDKFDYILTKTQYATDIFTSLLHNTVKDIKTCKQRVINIGWTSIDRYIANSSGELTCLHVCGKSIYKQTQLIIDSWTIDLPHLTVVYNKNFIQLEAKQQHNILYITDRLSDPDLNVLYNKHKIHLCVSQTEGFGHYINEAKSCGAIVITTNGLPMNSLIHPDYGYLINIDKKLPLPLTLGSKYIINPADMVETVNSIAKLPIDVLNTRYNLARQSYIQNNTLFIDALTKFFNKLVVLPKPEFNLSVTDLPHVSVITPTYNRRHMFKLAVYNWLHIDYPRDKIEWIIVDDSEPGQTVADLLPKDENIKYYYIDKKLSIGNKRNKCIELCKYDYICCMDDDDYYYNTNITQRITKLLGFKKIYPQVECVYCSTIACFHISKYISMINVPPHNSPYYERISEASLCFTRNFWQQQKFNNNSIGAEGSDFIKARLNACIEISWTNVFVALLHDKNTSSKIVVGDAPNGCHYGFSDDLFLFIVGLNQ